MMMNLFSMFDPCTLMFKEISWLIVLMSTLLIPLKKYLLNNYYSMMFNKVISYLLNEFMSLLKNSSMILFSMLVLFMLVFLNNVLGLFPYIFNSTSSLSVSLALGLTIWMSGFMMSILFNYSNLLVHLIPQGTPVVLMPFMVLIELISMLIRPFTLSIRLTANMIAGHLLMSLVSSSMENENIFLFLSGSFGQLMLSILETAVAMIQSYVFLVLIVLYNVDSLA